MTQQRHVIQRQILELQVSANQDPVKLKTRISHLCRQQLIPLIEAYCNQLSDSDTLIRIDRLELDLGEINLDTLEQDLVQQVEHRLSVDLAQKKTKQTPHPPSTLETEDIPHNATPQSPTNAIDANLELFHQFLHTGRLPWWSEALDSTALEERFNKTLTQAPNRLKTLLQQGLKQEKILQRFVYQFSEPMLMTALKLLAPNCHSPLCSYLSDLQILKPYVLSWQGITPDQLKQTIWQGLFPQLFNQPTFTPEILIKGNLLHLAIQLPGSEASLLQNLKTAISTLATTDVVLKSPLPNILSQLQPQASQTISLPRTVSNLQNLEEQTDIRLPDQSDDSIYIQNAGLVILWPFIERFFEKLELVQSGQFSTPQISYHAVLLLQHLVDASTESPEHKLPLNKLLCGIDLLDPIPAQLSLTETEQTECENLLTAVIHNWSALGNMSIDGLRRAFLQREGLLTPDYGNWLLRTERQTHDILLDQLPWSIRVVKLPWMDRILHVDF